MNVPGERSGETYSANEPLRGFDDYVAARTSSYMPERAAEIALLQSRLHAAVQIAQDINYVNAKLMEAGRPELTLMTPAPMDEMPDPLMIMDSSIANSFPSSLVVPPRTGDEDVSHDDIRQIMEGSYQRDDVMGGMFLLNDDFVGEPKPVIVRALIVAPELMSDAILRASSPETRDINRRAEETYAAYLVQSFLVDENDPNVLVNGVVNTSYLKQ